MRKSRHLDEMPSSAWTRQSGARPGPTISYAERLRQASFKQGTSHSNPPEQGPDKSNNSGDTEVSQAASSFEASAPSRAMLNSPKVSDTSTPSSLSPSHMTPSESELDSTNPNNVWELRMRRRNHRDIYAKQDTDTFSSPLNSKSKKSSTPQDTVSSVASFMRIDSDPSLEGAQDDTWLRRIYMLNGGKSKPRFIRSLPESASVSTPNAAPSAHSRANDASGASPILQNGTSLCASALHTPKTDAGGSGSGAWTQPWPYQPGAQSMYFMTPYGMIPSHAALPTTNADGSFSPYRSSDPLQQSMRNAAQVPMGYAPMIPMPEVPDNSVWSRRGRQVRGRAPPHTPAQGHVALNDASSSGQTLARQGEHVVDVHAQKENEESDDDSNRSEIESGVHGAPSVSLSPNFASGTRTSKWQSPLHGGTPTYMMPYMSQRGAPLMSYSMPMFPYMPMDPSIRPPVPMQFIPGYGQASFAATPSDAFALQQHLRTQVEFYFSDANLASDFYLRQQMDKEGFVPLDTILAFKRLRSLFQNAIPSASLSAEQESVPDERQRELLRTALMSSQSLELNVDRTKVRRLGHWQSFILPSEANGD